jgi:hypothetical protein
MGQQVFEGGDGDVKATPRCETVSVRHHTEVNENILISLATFGLRSETHSVLWELLRA